MSKKLSITEDEKKTIKGMYGLYIESMPVVTPTTTKHVYTHEELYTIKLGRSEYNRLLRPQEDGNPIVVPETYKKDLSGKKIPDETGYFLLKKGFTAPNGVKYYPTDSKGKQVKVKFEIK